LFSFILKCLVILWKLIILGSVNEDLYFNLKNKAYNKTCITFEIKFLI
jgi:hypothetical protein